MYVPHYFLIVKSAYKPDMYFFHFATRQLYVSGAVYKVVLVDPLTQSSDTLVSFGGVAAFAGAEYRVFVLFYLACFFGLAVIAHYF